MSSPCIINGNSGRAERLSKRSSIEMTRSINRHARTDDYEIVVDPELLV